MRAIIGAEGKQDMLKEWDSIDSGVVQARRHSSEQFRWYREKMQSLAYDS
jgi:hypothetical protein